MSSWRASGPDTGLPTAPPRGRGAADDPPVRHEAWARTREDDGWWQDPEPEPRTELRVDSARTILTRNDSPDLPFAQGMNPYRGCEHGCIYCYARPGHAWLGHSPGLEFETVLYHKPDAARLLRRELARPGHVCAPIALGTATDPYQPIERRLGLTRGLLAVLHELKHPVTLVTKSALVTRDLELLAALARARLVHVLFSITTLDRELARRLEPRAAAPQARLEAMRTLAEAGVPVGLSFAPVIPGLNDHEMERILAAAHAAGARSARYTLLRLPHELAGLFERWLAWHAPEKAARITAILYDLRGGRSNDPRFHTRMHGLGHFADLLRQRFELHTRRLGYGELPPLDCSRFCPPRPARAPAREQLSLF